MKILDNFEKIRKVKEVLRFVDILSGWIDQFFVTVKRV